jgi:glycosyltransferase involved in cell wall biosynthesis
MKILYGITKSNWGGAQRHVFDLATEAKKEGFDVVVALGGDGALKQKLEEAGVRTIQMNSLRRDISVGGDTHSFKDFMHIIKAEKPDILHLHSPKAGGIGAFAGRLRRVPKIIYTAHGWAWNEDRPRHEKASIAFFSWLTMICTTTTITLSKKETDQALLFPFVQKKICHIPLGIVPPHFVPHTAAIEMIEKTINTSLSKRTILGTISELHHNKGLTYLIEAVKEAVVKFPTLAVVIIGDGELRDTLQQQIDKLELKNNVYLAGYIPGASAYLKAFNVFLLTSVKEGLPYVIFESAYAEVPVIATAVGGIPELIDDMSSGVLIQPKKPSEIAHAIEFMLKHKTTEKDYAKALHTSIKEKFPISGMYEKTFSLYKN